MGGSLALALKRRSRSFRIFGISRSTQKIRQAIRKGIIDQGSTHLEEIPAKTELVIIATPVPQIVPIVRKIDRVVKSPILVTDVGSTKDWILREIRQACLKKVKFVGSHPMAGDHETGLNAARKDLYEDSLVFITRDGASSSSQKKVNSFWRTVGANRLITLSAKDHDRIVGEISHLPHLVAAMLTLNAKPEHIVLSGPGFKDATRIAQGDPDLWLGIVASNKHVPAQLAQFEKHLQKIMSIIRRKQWTRLHDLLSEACRRRRNL